MDTHPSISDETIFAYLDGKLSPSQRALFEEHLRTSETLQARLTAFSISHDALRADTVLPLPPDGFTENVMQRLENSLIIPRPSPRNGIVLLICMLLVTGAGILLLDAGVFNSVTRIIPSRIFPGSFDFSKLPSLSVSGKLVMKILLATTTVLAFVLLDRTIFRPMFARRAGMMESRR